jgi:hypothetical protein
MIFKTYSFICHLALPNNSGFQQDRSAEGVSFPGARPLTSTVSTITKRLIQQIGIAGNPVLPDG